MYNSPRQDYYFNQNCTKNNVYRDSYNNWRTFNFLINNWIIDFTNREFYVNIKSDSRAEDIENLISLPIPEVAYLSVSVREWNNNIANFFSNNNIKSFKDVVLMDASSKSVEVGLWMDAFLKMLNRITGHVELYDQKIKPYLFARFFSNMNYNNGILFLATYYFLFCNAIV